MKIVIIGPGIMPIPPVGWGAVESLIWDYRTFLEKRPGVSVHIINSPNHKEIIYLTNQQNPDVVHIQYDNHCYIVPHLTCKNVLMTSHYGYIESLEYRNTDGYWGLFKTFIESSAKIHALSPGIRDMYIKYGASPERVVVLPNGANADVFRYNPECELPDRSVYLAKIDYRKKQYLYQNIDFIDFVGNYADRSFDPNRKNYLGEWNKPTLYQNLTKYANLVLLSDGEAHPLVCCEAMMAGLGLVVSTYAAGNLDLEKPWISVVPNNKLGDIAYVTEVIKKNQEASVKHREEIRQYALEHFSWDVIVDKYLEMLEGWFGIKSAVITNGVDA